MNARCIANLRVTLCQRAHARIMKRGRANVTFGFGVQCRAIHYPDQLVGLETAAPCSCNADSRSLLTISSTKAASDRGKMNEYFGPFPAAGEITRFSERK